MSVLQLNLNDLTLDKLAEAKPHCGEFCRYIAPCIIGTIVPEDQREALDNADTQNPCLDDSAVGTLAENQLIRFPTVEQEADAIEMQQSFDAGDWDRVEHIAGKYL